MSDRKPVTVEVRTPSTAPCGCDGSGRIETVTRDPNEYDTGKGFIVGGGTSYSTSLCKCRRLLEPREGKARWWTSEQAYFAPWESSVHHHEATVSARVEVPVSEDDYVLIRNAENFYYPTLIDLDVSDEGLHALFPDEARALAALLVAAAETCEALDGRAASLPGSRDDA